jgi:hypothetical protein
MSKVTRLHRVMHDQVNKMRSMTSAASNNGK